MLSGWYKIKLRPRLELTGGGGGKGNNHNKKGWRRKWDASVLLFFVFLCFCFWRWNGIPKRASFKAPTWILLFAGWASFSGVISRWILRVFLRGAQEANHEQTKRRLANAYSQPPSSFHWRGLSQALLLGCENKPDGCAISIFWPLAESLEQSRAAGLLED